jgi:hypothetical protein
VGLDGRGRWDRWDKKDTVDDYLALSAHHILTRITDPETAGLYTVTWTREGKGIGSVGVQTVPGAGVILRYSYAGEPVPPYLVRWDVTTPRFGGRRYWWLCPQCGRRCATLYGGPRFLCRVCHNLTYETAQSGGDLRATIDRRMLAIRRRLGAHTGPGWPFNPLPPKPRAMHWDTYDRLAREYASLAELREFSFLVDLCGLAGWPGEVGYTPDDLRDMLKDGWAAYRRANRPKRRANKPKRGAKGAAKPGRARGSFTTAHAVKGALGGRPGA